MTEDEYDIQESLKALKEAEEEGGTITLEELKEKLGMSDIKIQKVEIDTPDGKLRLTLKQVHELRDILNENFPSPNPVTIREEHHHYPIPWWPSTPYYVGDWTVKSGSVSSGFVHTEEITTTSENFDNMMVLSLNN